jgi:thermostable 8-oxoguanine DNA glycosylase
MTSSAAEQLAQYVRSTQGFVFYETIDGNYNHIGATVADAILQANNNYKTNVKPRVNRILAQYPNSRTTSAVRNLLQSLPVTEFLKWRGADRAARFSQVLDLFAVERIETEADLRTWLLRESNLSKLRAIKGIGPKTIDYFKILVGVSTSAIDRHLLNFLGLAGLSPCGYADAQSIVNATADMLRVDRAYFDHSIWQYMSKRAAASQSGSVVAMGPNK